MKPTKRHLSTMQLAPSPALPRRRFGALAAAAVAASPVARATTTVARPIRIGQIGVGHGHATKLAVYRASPDYDVVGICEPDEALRRGARERPPFAGLPWMTRDELLALPGLDAVLVETRVGDLLDQAEAAVAAGKHVHVDKPAGTSLGQLRRLLAAAEARGLLVQTGYMYRYNPAVLLLREFLRAGWLGEVFEIHAVMSKLVGDAERDDLVRQPGGTMFELGCHLVDLVVAILGAPQHVAAFPRHSGARDDGLLDNMLAVLEYPRATATIRTSVIEVDGWSRRQLTVCGTEGTLSIQPLDDPAVRLSLSRARGDHPAGTSTVTFPKFTRYVADAADMARIIRGEKRPDFDSAHDLAVQDAVFSASALPGDR
ncbi:MAG: Gfo/Idh/MocA family protein [Planctomycetota bacterium]